MRTKIAGAWRRKGGGAIPPRLVAPLLCVLLLPLAGLLWLGNLLLEQDRTLESKRREELLQRVLESAAASLSRHLAELQRGLQCSAQEHLRNAVIVKLESSRTRWCAGEALPWVAESGTMREAAADVFASAERAEFGTGNPGTAWQQYQLLSASDDNAIRAGALLRMARTMRRSGRAAEALPVYRALAKMRDVAVAGTPADLAARAALCRVLSDLGRREELRAEALALARDLDGGRWPVERGAYEMHREDTEQWLGQRRNPAREELAVAVAGLRKRWRSGKLDGESAGLFVEGPATVIWRMEGASLLALVAKQDYVEKELLAGSGVQLAVGSRGDAARSFPGLPWAIQSVREETPEIVQEFALRRRAVFGFLAIAMLLTAGSAWVLWRAFARERALTRMQSDFVAAVSHEFRTPLTNMKQIAEVLSEGRLIHEDRRQTYYESLGRATLRLQRLVESLLNFARMEAKAMPYQIEAVRMRELMRAVGDDFRFEYERQGVRLEMGLPEEPIEVRGDREALRQAVWNLLDNAVKYSPPASRVWMEAERNGDRVYLRVRDEGPGIPAHEQRHILKKFVRGESAKSAGIRGTGIGLSLVGHIMRAHGGTLELKSEPGKGSTFTLALPVEETCPAS